MEASTTLIIKLASLAVHAEELFSVDGREADKQAIVGLLLDSEVRAFLNDPKLLLLDEATASLDPYIADKTRKVLKKVQREKGVRLEGEKECLITTMMRAVKTRKILMTSQKQRLMICC